MSIDLQAKSLDGQAHYFKINASPDRCPQCHTSVHPKLLTQHLSADQSEAYVTFLCTSRRCLRPFVATYRRQSMHGADFALRFTAPRNTIQSEFPASIKEVSPTFCEIYGQAENAKADGLDQLVGIGLRKALEFLVKDFAKSEHTDSVEKVEHMQLGKCIDTYISDQNVLQCAKRAAWLGNDETHYIRKWTDKDVSDLSLLVRLTVNWIDNHLLTKKYISEMSGGA
ncbi:hypothetical protein FHT09_001244 [Xanthomonas arboricola]|uniref:DUF4145 domain-containing protein n=1 Tax=Xanthomonas TaxID=338 RepID=UPI000CEE12B2|nr:MULTISPECIES: DUF4145 domain-containing protein [Xanthomonas]MBB5735545.1 hypothetical protein [Xanthomonas sp. CFBP 8152]PPT78543.1 hypothetical protein XarbCFBP8152_11540 [Xanthomonas arboricola]